MLVWSAVLLHRVVAVGKGPFQIMIGMFAFMPLHFHMIQGQVDVVLLPIYLLTLKALKEDRAWQAGLILAIGLLKFHFVLRLALILAIRFRWKFLSGFALGSVLFVALCVAISGFSETVHYVKLLTQIGSIPHIGVYPPMMANLRGLFYLIFGHNVPLLTLTVSAALIAWAIYAWRALETGFALAVTVTLLVSYHLNPHSLTLLILPMAIAIKKIKWLSAAGATWLLLATPVLLLIVTWRKEIAWMAIPIAAFAFFAFPPQQNAQPGRQAATS